MWTAAGNLANARSEHTATPLLDGRVLVTGGASSAPGIPVPLASAELYDPTNGTWTTTGGMIEARRGHSATLLEDGRVLVAGGYGTDSQILTSAELYDPRTGTWAATGNMAETRSAHTATLLPGGQVLVGGASGSSGHLPSAELYDPNNGTWTTTGGMIDAREFHTATLLPDGTVLVVGGHGSSGTLASAELYDPSTTSWTVTRGTLKGRVSHTATLLRNGMVLVAGGSGGDSYTPSLASTELYDPSSGTWTATGNMIDARSGHTATLLPDGTVLVAGGDRGTTLENQLASTELYDPASGSWTAAANMNGERDSHTATLLPNGGVLVLGGGSSIGLLTFAELYDPGTP